MTYNEETSHLIWIRNRLIHVHGEHPNVDYIIKFDEIIKKRKPFSLSDWDLKTKNI